MDTMDELTCSVKLSGQTEAALPQEENGAMDPVFADILARAEREELPVEEAFAALEQIVQKMEKDDISLEDSFSCYEAGIRLVRYCSGRIDRVEKKVQMLRGEGEAPLDAGFED